MEINGRGTPGLQIQQQTNYICLQVQVSSSHCSGCSGYSMGLVQPYLLHSSAEASSLSAPQNQENCHSGDTHSTKLTKVNVILRPY